MRVAIIGSGAVGGYFGAMLAKAGHDVAFFARGEQLQALQQNGLFIKSIHGDFHLPHVNAFNHIADIDHADLIIMAVKAWQVQKLAQNLGTIVAPSSMILPLQNGVLAAEEISKTLDKSIVLNGLCRIFSKIEAPGIIHHFALEPSITFGEQNGTITPRAQTLKSLFDEAGIRSKLSEDIQAELWKKFIGICVSGLLAVTHCNYGELRQIPETRQMMIELLNEIHTLATKMHINLEPDIVDKTVTAIDTYPPETTSSLTRDIWENKPSELEYQNGTVVKLGLEYNVPTPVNRFIYHSLLPTELKARTTAPDAKK